MHSVSQEEWERRAAVVSVEWLEPVSRAAIPAQARCLKCGHEWGLVPNYAKQGRGCPRCSGREVPADVWDERARRAGLEWAGPYVNARTRRAARCLTCGYEWNANPDSVKSGSGCPRCSGVARVTQEQWDERAAASGLEWLAPVKSGYAHTLVRCFTCGYEWELRASRTLRKVNCPGCMARRQALRPPRKKRPKATGPGGGRRKTSRRSTSPPREGCKVQGVRTGKEASPRPRPPAPQIAQEEWDGYALRAGVKWLSPVTDSTKRTPVRCLKCGYEWEKTPVSVAQRTGGCPQCAGHVVSDAEWDRRAKEAGIEWTAPHTNARTRRPARCLTCGHQWSPTPGSIQGGTGCPSCSGTLKVTQEQWDAVAREAGLVWLEAVASRQTNTRARCLTCGHEWKANPGHVRGDRTGCPKCGVRKAAEARRKTPEQWAAEAAALDLEYLEPVKGALFPARARCLKCGFEWMPWPVNVTVGKGCPECTPTGFKSSEPAYVYLLVRGDQVAKVGITGVGKTYEERMKKHRRNGYREQHRWRFEKGSDAYAVEQQVILRWREEDDLPPAADYGEDGFMETVDSSRLSLEVIIHRINHLAGQAGGAPEAL